MAPQQRGQAQNNFSGTGYVLGVSGEETVTKPPVTEDDYATSDEEGSADYRPRSRVADEEDSDEAAEFEGPELGQDEIEMRNDDGTYSRVKISKEEAAALASKQYEDSLQERNDWKLSELKLARRFAEIAREAKSDSKIPGQKVIDCGEDHRDPLARATVIECKRGDWVEDRDHGKRGNKWPLVRQSVPDELKNVACDCVRCKKHADFQCEMDAERGTMRSGKKRQMFTEDEANIILKA